MRGTRVLMRRRNTSRKRSSSPTSSEASLRAARISEGSSRVRVSCTVSRSNSWRSWVRISRNSGLRRKATTLVLGLSEHKGQPRPVLQFQQELDLLEHGIEMFPEAVQSLAQAVAFLGEGRGIGEQLLPERRGEQAGQVGHEEPLVAQQEGLEVVEGDGELVEVVVGQGLLEQSPDRGLVLEEGQDCLAQEGAEEQGLLAARGRCSATRGW